MHLRSFAFSLAVVAATQACAWFMCPDVSARWFDGLIRRHHQTGQKQESLAGGAVKDSAAAAGTKNPGGAMFANSLWGPNSPIPGARSKLAMRRYKKNIRRAKFKRMLHRWM